MMKPTKSFSFQWSIKRLRLVVPLLAAMALTLLLCGCQPAAHSEKTLRIGVAVYQQDDTFISTVVQNLERMAREEETARGVKINLTILDGQSNQTVQLEQINRMLEQGCNVLCVNIVDRTAAAVLIDKAQKENVPLIFFNRQPVEEDMQRWDQVYYVGADAAESGQLQGEIVRTLWQTQQERVDRNGDGILQYIMLEGEPGHQDTLLRTQYATQPLSAVNIKLERLASQSANWKRGEAANLTKGYLEAFDEQIEVIFANNDDMALGAVDAYEAEGKPLPVIVGVDATPPALEAIENGTLQGTVRNDSEGIARAMMSLTLALHTEQPASQAVTLEDGHYVWLPYRKIVQE